MPALLVFAEPDLGSAMIFLLIWLGMAIMAGCDMRHILGSIGMVIAIAAVRHRRGHHGLPARAHQPLPRPEQGLDGLRLQHPPGRDQRRLRRAGSGKGLTNGTQTQLDYLRTQTTDYVFSVLGEELGFVGALILFALFILLLMRGLRAAAISREFFGQLIAVGVVIFILFQAFINIGVNIRLFPVTGIPLPFVSQGGSSLVTVFIAIGLLESVIMRHRQVSL